MPWLKKGLRNTGLGYMYYLKSLMSVLSWPLFDFRLHSGVKLAFVFNCNIEKIWWIRMEFLFTKKRISNNKCRFWPENFIHYKIKSVEETQFWSNFERMCMTCVWPGSHFFLNSRDIHMQFVYLCAALIKTQLQLHIF